MSDQEQGRYYVTFRDRKDWSSWTFSVRADGFGEAEIKAWNAVDDEPKWPKKRADWVISGIEFDY